MILHVIKSNIYSGAENVVCQIINGLKNQEECIYMSPRGPIEDKLKALGLYDSYRGIDKLDIKSIKDAVSALHPTVVHAHDFTASVLCAFALKGSVPVVSHLHNNPPWIQSVNIKTISYLLASKWISQVVTVSDAVKSEFVFSKKLTCPITVVGNPFSVESVVSQIDEAPESDVLFVGRLVEQKDPKMILKVAQSMPETTFRLVGFGELMDDLQAYKKDNAIDNVCFEGFTKNSYSYMANAKVLMMPSKWEGFGLVALEAMSFGLPVVTSGEGGLSQIVDSTCGYICKSESDYIAAIRTLLSNSEDYTKKAAGAKARAAAYDNIKTYCQSILEIYDSLR